MAEPPGRAFGGRYRIITLIAEGDRKRTYLALDTITGHHVVLVIIKPEASESDSSETAREVEFLAQVSPHSNIVVLYDYGISDHTEFQVFEYLPGGTLEERIKAMERQDRYLSFDEIIRLARQLARALAHIHMRGIIHRAVTPANIWLDDRDVAHLGDFGSAIRVDTHQHAIAPPAPNQVYAAPEQIAGVHLDERSDFYSLGAVLYEAATNEPPVRINKGILTPRLLRPEIPSNLNAIIYSLLADNPDDRPNASEVLEALKAASDQPISRDECAPEAVGEKLSYEHRFVFWMDSLPFPVASVLWRYHAEIEPDAKVEWLLKFFEALAQFAATVQLSAYILDRSFFDSINPSSLSADSRSTYHPDIRRPTFGTWVKVSQYLSQKTNHALSNRTGSAARCYELYSSIASDRDDLISTLASPEFIGILQVALNSRNDWLGHGGAANRHEHKRRLHDLEMLLARLQNLLASSFETWTLLKPGSAAFTDGAFYLTAISLMGSRSEFRKVERRLAEALDTSHLYLLNSDTQKTLKIVPFIRILAGQKTGQDACYFFNRLQAEGVRWVSYHHRAEPELILHDGDVLQLLSSLRHK
jgi:serine/threonine protein kinase